MKRKAVVLSLLLALCLCLCLCVAARADFSLNPLPDPMAIPEQFDLFSGEAPALPTVEVGEAADASAGQLNPTRTQSVHESLSTADRSPPS